MKIPHVDDFSVRYVRARSSAAYTSSDEPWGHAANASRPGAVTCEVLPPPQAGEGVGLALCAAAIGFLAGIGFGELMDR